MKCVVCEVDMRKKIINGIEIDFCPICEGIWLDEGELEAFTGLNPAESRELTCPICDCEMKAKVVNYIEINYCPDCESVWLEKGEFEKMSGINPNTGRETLLHEFIHSDYYKTIVEGEDDNLYKKKAEQDPY